MIVLLEKVAIALIIILATLYLGRRYWITYKKAQEKEHPCEQGCAQCDVSDHCAQSEMDLTPEAESKRI